MTRKPRLGPDRGAVIKVLDLLRAELALVMVQMGTPTLADIGQKRLGRT